ncbi:MAG: ABC transporter ATP-binding protein [Oscillospiraceae bacterium]|jgi:branched-chain amino acid transport system ATP-binding protein|nr:ABC transporter ATP-binding protein [Oscillospiraceae bacterium]
MITKVLTIKDLKISYGAIEAVKGINLEVHEGRITALLGANGAGKTSTLRAISGLVPSSGGSIKFYEKEISKLSADKIAKQGIAQSPEGRLIFGDLTVEENLRIGAYTVNKRIMEQGFARCYRYFPRLEERKKQISYTLSGGELQMLAIGRALMASPKVLLLDEPSLGLAPLIVKDIFKIINDIKGEGGTVLLVEQNALQTLKIADYAYVMETGTIKIHGEASELMNDKRLVDAYLGEH